MDMWLLYLLTVLVFMSTPGPSHLLMLSNSLGNGFARSTATAAGDLSANFLQMIAASLGLATILNSSQGVFVMIKWAGVLYLAYLGLKLIFSPQGDFSKAKLRSLSSLYWQGFITSAANPKAVIFFAALFPQFLSPEQPLLPQFLILSITYLLVDGLFLCLYGKFAEVFRQRMLENYADMLNKLSGGLFLAAAVLLGYKDLERR
jgi:threonine/homoserine/homoserine lactone efflux protein